jgi:hypothetical protein
VVLLALAMSFHVVPLLVRDGDWAVAASDADAVQITVVSALVPGCSTDR